MSASVSQIEFWQKGLAFNGNNNGNEGSNGGTFLSYDVFLGLSVLGGFLALDHLYLRSPLTFLAKLVVNILFFGVWWVYDAAQAIFNGDIIKVYGLGVPGLGPKGIACGVLAKDEPDKKHLRFFMYAAALIFGGMFGLDSFLVGNKTAWNHSSCVYDFCLFLHRLRWHGGDGIWYVSLQIPNRSYRNTLDFLVPLRVRWRKRCLHAGRS